LFVPSGRCLYKASAIEGKQPSENSLSMVVGQPSQPSWVHQYKAPHYNSEQLLPQVIIIIIIIFYKCFRCVGEPTTRLGNENDKKDCACTVCKQ